MSHEIKKIGSRASRISQITVNDNKVIKWRPDLTVGEVCTLAGYKDRHFTVFVNGVVIRGENYNTCKVPKKARVKIMYLSQGG
jgi:thiamine biosynthesis protein ThiS